MTTIDAWRGHALSAIAIHWVGDPDTAIGRLITAALDSRSAADALDLGPGTYPVTVACDDESLPELRLVNARTEAVS